MTKIIDVSTISAWIATERTPRRGLSDFTGVENSVVYHARGSHVLNSVFYKSVEHLIADGYELFAGDLPKIWSLSVWRKEKGWPPVAIVYDDPKFK